MLKELTKLFALWWFSFSFVFHFFFCSLQRFLLADANSALFFFLLRDNFNRKKNRSLSISLKEKQPSRRFFHLCTLYSLYFGILGDHFVIPFEKQNERKTKRLAVCNSLVSLSNPFHLDAAFEWRTSGRLLVYFQFIIYRITYIKRTFSHLLYECFFSTEYYIKIHESDFSVYFLCYMLFCIVHSLLRCSLWWMKITMTPLTPV